MDVGEHTTLGDGHTGEQLVELLIVADGQLEVAGDDAGLLVVAGSVAGKLENLGREVLEDGGEVHGGTGTDALGVVALAEETVDTAHGELEAGPRGAGLALARLGASLALALACLYVWEREGERIVHHRSRASCAKARSDVNAGNMVNAIARPGRSKDADALRAEVSKQVEETYPTCLRLYQ